MSNDETHKRLQGAFMRIRAEHPFFGTLALFADLRVDDSVDTAGTEGKALWFNPQFVAKQSINQLCGLVTHELLHAALLHAQRRKERDVELWNIAADIVVNGMVREATNYDLPQGGVELPKLAKLSVEEVYEQLATGRVAKPSIRLLDLWMYAPDSAVGQASGSLAEEDVAALSRHWRAALQQASAVAHRVARGFGSQGLGAVRDAVQALQPTIDWRDRMWEFLVSTPFDFRGFDRRFLHRKLYVEEMQGDTVEVAICIDTSGSIGQKELSEFLGEIGGIVDAYPEIKGRLFFADAELYGPFDFGRDIPIPAPKGGGGTDFRPFLNVLDRSKDPTSAEALAIFFTDGYGEFPARAPADCRVLWVVSPGGLVNSGFPFGEVVRMGS
jgi:predicted metal-dependent peptidase